MSKRNWQGHNWRKVTITLPDGYVAAVIWVCKRCGTPTCNPSTIDPPRPTDLMGVIEAITEELRHLTCEEILVAQVMES